MDKNMKTGIEIERKYIIKMPDVNILSKQQNYTESQITQIYIYGEKNETRRIRRRIYPDKNLYFETVKHRIDEMSSVESERELDGAEYDFMAKMIIDGTRPVEKIRYTFSFSGQTFEIDVYPEWKNTAIMETELTSREATVTMPTFVEIVREVTGNKAYSNAAMSRQFPDEDK